MALIPSFFPDCVVALGVDNPEGKRNWYASGFLYGHYMDSTEKEKKLYSVYLVTNRHVLKEVPKIYLRFNPKANEPACEYDIQLLNKDGTPIWFTPTDPEIDIGVLPINFGLLKEHGIQTYFFYNNHHAANIEKLVELGISEGDFVYALGFPMGLVGGERNVVIIRSGTIARIRDTLAKDSNEYLIDAFIFPGNSGGPVVSKPEALAIEGTKSQEASYLIGIVKSNVTYQDIAISLQTKHPRVVFEENSGLAAVHPVDFIEEAIREHLKKIEF